MMALFSVWYKFKQKKKAFTRETKCIQSLRSSLEIAPIIKGIVLDILKCITSNDLLHMITVPWLAVLHDLLPTFTNSFATYIPTLLETILKLVNSNHPRASSNAHILIQEIAALFDPIILLTIAAKQPPSMQFLKFISFPRENKKTSSLRDTILCERILKLSFQCHDLWGFKVNPDIIQQFLHQKFQRYGENVSTWPNDEDISSYSKVQSKRYEILDRGDHKNRNNNDEWKNGFAV